MFFVLQDLFYLIFALVLHHLTFNSHCTTLSYYDEKKREKKKWFYVRILCGKDFFFSWVTHKFKRMSCIDGQLLKIDICE